MKSTRLPGRRTFLRFLAALIAAPTAIKAGNPASAFDDDRERWLREWADLPRIPVHESRDPVTIAATGRKLKINSDAKYQFERGVDPEYTLPGLEAATQMALDLCGGEPSDVVVAGAPINWKRAYKLDAKRVEGLVGMSIPETLRIPRIET